MAVVISSQERTSRTTVISAMMSSLRRQSRAIERLEKEMRAEGATAAAIQTAANALLVDWGASRDQIVTELTAIPIVHQVTVDVGQPSLYQSAVIDAADPANPVDVDCATIRVNSYSETLVSPFSAFTFGDVVTISKAEDSGNNISAKVHATPHATPTTDLITNGNFTTDTLWTKGAGWTIAGGAAVATGAISTALKSGTGGGTAMSTAWTAGQYYLVSYTVLTLSAGYINIGTNTSTTQANATTIGAKTALILADGHADGLVFTGAGFTGTIDGVEVIPFTGLALDRPLTTDNAADTSLKITLQER